MDEYTLVASGGLDCIGRGREASRFYFEAKRHVVIVGSWEFSVWPDEVACKTGLVPETSLQPFLLELVALDDARLRVAMIEDYGQQWAVKKGIGPALLVKARGITAKRIVSSVRYSAEERREDKAEEMWRKMVCRRQAIYHSSDVRYEVVY
jgi:hypothetical protein